MRGPARADFPHAPQRHGQLQLMHPLGALGPNGDHKVAPRSFERQRPDHLRGKHRLGWRQRGRRIVGGTGLWVPGPPGAQERGPRVGLQQRHGAPGSELAVGVDRPASPRTAAPMHRGGVSSAPPLAPMTETATHQSVNAPSPTPKSAAGGPSPTASCATRPCAALTAWLRTAPCRGWSQPTSRHSTADTTVRPLSSPTAATTMAVAGGAAAGVARTTSWPAWPPAGRRAVLAAGGAGVVSGSLSSRTSAPTATGAASAAGATRSGQRTTSSQRPRRGVGLAGSGAHKSMRTASPPAKTASRMLASGRCSRATAPQASKGGSAEGPPPAGGGASNSSSSDACVLTTSRCAMAANRVHSGTPGKSILWAARAPTTTRSPRRGSQHGDR